MVSTGTGTMPTEYFCTNTGKQITVSDCLRQIAALEKQIVGRDNEIIVIRDTARIAIAELEKLLAAHEQRWADEFALRGKQTAALERELAEAKGLYHEALVDGDATRFKMRMLETELKAAQDHAASMEASCRELDSKLLAADLENKRLEAKLAGMVPWVAIQGVIDEIHCEINRMGRHHPSIGKRGCIHRLEKLRPAALCPIDRR